MKKKSNLYAELVRKELETRNVLFKDMPADGAKKYDELKLRYDLMPLDAEAKIVEIYTRGAAKYGDRNWEKGMSWGRLYAAARRHLDRFWAGEDLDPEWDTPHLAHAAVCIQMLLAYQLRGSGQDDRAQLPTELETVLKDVGADGRSHES